MDKDLKEALEIAKRDLRECYTDTGILAGRGHFQQYWARDAFFASLGANSLEDFNQVKKTLQLFLDLQSEDGAIPAMITKSLKPKFRPLLLSKPVDSNALFIISAADYAKKSEDNVLLEKNFKKISLAMDWLCKKDRDKDSLIEEGYLANWADTVLKHGEVLYSNCCYFHALKEFSSLAEELGVEMIASEYQKRAQETKLALNLKFWENEYYYDWIGLTPHNYFASDGNILAIVWDIATKHRAKNILKFVEEKRLNTVPLKTNTPPYPLWKIVPLLVFMKAYYYHNGFSWPWLGCMHAIALNKVGKEKKAKQELKKLASQINEFSVTHEVFNQKSEPVESFFLKSEKTFAWTAGLFIRAMDEIIGLRKKDKE